MIALMRRILAVAGPYRGRIQLAAVCSFFKSLLAKAPLFLTWVILSAFSGGTADGGLCLRAGLVLVLCLAAQALLHHGADRLQSAAGYLVFSDLRIALGAHLRRMPMGYFTEGNIGRISAVLSSDMVFIEENCMNVLADLMSYGFSQVILLGFLAAFDWRLGLAALLLALAAVAVARAMGREALRDSEARQAQNQRLTEAVLDHIEGIAVIKAYHLLGEKSRQLTDSFRRSCETSLRFEEHHSPWQRRLLLIYGLGAAALIGLAAALYSRGELPAMSLVAMLLVALDLFGPLKALYSQATRLTVMNSCMDRVEAVFAEPQLPDSGREHLPERFGGPEVEFRHVSFGYGEREVLHDVSFSAPRGSTVALVGPSGGGKSTVASLLTRFWDVQRGQVLVRGRDIRQVPLGELMDQMSVVFQRVYLFQDTVFNNIRMGRPDATREEVLDAARKARCYDFVQRLPQGFDTMVGEGGATLSGGEKQRISIARCILKDAPIVILDEATASVDADNEREIQEALSQLCRGKTLLVIAHRLHTIRDADTILVVDDGRIVESGTHGQLMARGGLYRDLVTIRRETKGWNRRQTGE